MSVPEATGLGGAGGAGGASSSKIAVSRMSPPANLLARSAISIARDVSPFSASWPAVKIARFTDAASSADTASRPSIPTMGEFSPCDDAARSNSMRTSLPAEFPAAVAVQLQAWPRSSFAVSTSSRAGAPLPKTMVCRSERNATRDGQASKSVTSFDARLLTNSGAIEIASDKSCATTWAAFRVGY